MKYVNENYTDFVMRQCLSVLMYCYFSSTSISQLLAYIHAVSAKYRTEKMYADLFLYSVRTGSYVRRRLLAPPILPVIKGSDENGFTLIKHCFKREV